MVANALLLAMLSASAPVLSEQIDSNARELDAVVVTAAGFEKKVAAAPASISVITAEDLSRKQFANLAEALDEVEGVDVGQATGKTGGLEVSIRGMPSTYTLVLIDGRRQNNVGDVTPNGFGEVANNFMPPLAAIERIEVVRGPMSSLYGSDAVGGVVNIITRKATASLVGSATIDHVFHQDSHYGAASAGSFFVAGPAGSERISFAIRGRLYDRGASDLRFKDGTPVSRRGAAAVEGMNYGVGARLAYAPSDEHEFFVDIDRGRQTYSNDDCQLGTLDGWSGTEWAGCTTASAQANGYRDELRFSRDQLVLGHMSELGFGTWESVATYKVNETVGRTVPGTMGVAWIGFPDIVGGAPRRLESEDLVVDSKVVAPLAGGHTLVFGGQYVDADASDGLATDAFLQKSWSVFVEDDWAVRENLNLTVGGRYERHNAFGGHFNPRSYLTWRASPAWTIKGGIGRGYRVPTLNQLHDGINGAIQQGRVITIGTPSLKPETSTNYEVGFYYTPEGAAFDANLTFFHTRLKNMIGVGVPVSNCWFTASPQAPGCLDLGAGFTQDSFAQAANIDSARSYGTEFSSRLAMSETVSIDAAYTYARTTQVGGIDDGAAVTNQPRHSLNASLRWEAGERSTWRIRGEHFSSRARFPNRYENLAAADQAIQRGLGDLKPYSQVHLEFNYRASERLAISAVLYNLANTDFVDCGYYENELGNTVCGARYFQLGRLPAGHTTTWGGNKERRRLWLSARFDF